MRPFFPLPAWLSSECSRGHRSSLALLPTFRGWQKSPTHDQRPNAASSTSRSRNAARSTTRSAGSRRSPTHDRRRNAASSTSRSRNAASSTPRRRNAAPSTPRRRNAEGRALRARNSPFTGVPHRSLDRLTAAGRFAPEIFLAFVEAWRQGRQHSARTVPLYLKFRRESPGWLSPCPIPKPQQRPRSHGPPAPQDLRSIRPAARILTSDTLCTV